VSAIYDLIDKSCWLSVLVDDEEKGFGMAMGYPSVDWLVFLYVCGWSRTQSIVVETPPPPIESGRDTQLGLQTQHFNNPKTNTFVSNREIQALVRKGIIQPYDAVQLQKPPDPQDGVTRRLIIGESSVCMYIYIYICVCVCVYAC
jgi:hypothetical protein